MTTYLSPVTEDEMHRFFERIASTLVGLSDQAKELASAKAELEQLRQTVNDTAARLERITTESSGLRREIADTWQFATNLERERDEARQGKAQAEDELFSARATVGGYEKSNSDLTHEVGSLRSQLEQATNKVLELEGTNQRLSGEIQQHSWQRDRHNARIDELEQANAKLRKDADDWQAIAEGFEKERDELKTKLNSIRSFFAEAPKPQPIIEDKGWTPPEPPTEEVKPTLLESVKEPESEQPWWTQPHKAGGSW